MNLYTKCEKDFKSKFESFGSFVGKVAKDLGLNYILFDIKPEYCELARLFIAGQKNKVHKDQYKLL